MVHDIDNGLNTLLGLVLLDKVSRWRNGSMVDTSAPRHARQERFIASGSHRVIIRKGQHEGFVKLLQDCLPQARHGIGAPTREIVARPPHS